MGEAWGMGYYTNLRVVLSEEYLIGVFISQFPSDIG